MFRHQFPEFQFVFTASGPVTGYHWKEPGSIFFTSFLQVFVYIDKTFPPLGFSLFYVHISLVLKNPEVDGCITPGVASPVLSVGKDHLPRASGSTPPNAAQDTTGCLCGKYALLAHVRLAIHQNLQVLFYQPAFQLGCPQHMLVHGFVPLQVSDFTLSLVELYELPVISLLQPVKVLFEWQHNPLAYQPLLFCVLCLQQTCWLCIFCIINHQHRCWTGFDPGVQFTGLQLDFVPLNTMLWVWLFSQFSAPSKTYESLVIVVNISKTMFQTYDIVSGAR